MAYELNDVGRFRCNFLYQHHGIGAVFRIIPTKILTLEELKMPEAIKTISEFNKGLVLVTGPTGSGKSTTLAAIIDYINEKRDAHIITIEDPLEFVHLNNKCIFTQREIGSHATNFAKALEVASREDPDIILVGEMRDLETISLALTCAELGILVFGTLHTNSAPKKARAFCRPLCQRASLKPASTASAPELPRKMRFLDFPGAMAASSSATSIIGA